MLGARSKFASSFMLLVAVACGGVVEHDHPSATGDASTGGANGIGGSGIGNGGTSSTGGKLNATGGTTGIGGTTGTTSSPPSCQGLASNCGPSSNESCCTSPRVPGGTFYRSYDNVHAGYTSQAYPATVSDFRLDEYEITVGRFRSFVAVFSPNMIPGGSGKNPNDASDSGWDTTWNTALPENAAALSTILECDSGYQTWTETAGRNETLPINCLSWFEAFAFCIWDGGRLPTEAEWNYAAAGGSEQRVYAWGSDTPDDGLVVFCGAACSKPEAVGTKSPNGDGKWAQADLAGNVYEWTLDWYARPYPQSSCTNCANMTIAAGRTFRGGDFASNAMGLLSSSRNGGGPGDHGGGIGARCARAPVSTP
jgi:sulfatase modifying factor 1